MESRFPTAAIDALERLGHTVHSWGSWNEQAGHAHGITIGEESRMLSGGSDPRSDGAAIGF
jgi:gamma-glutamyltranspeptidase/glutathione hydrolase